MGTLRIGSGHWYHFDDRWLQLLRTTITTRLIIGESFDLCIHPPSGQWPAERVRVTPQTPAMFLFQSSAVDAVDDEVLLRLLAEIELTGALQCSSS